MPKKEFSILKSYSPFEKNGSCLKRQCDTDRILEELVPAQNCFTLQGR